MSEKHPYKPGDEVEWSSHGSRTHGKVEEEITETKQAAGRKVKASEDEPQYRVRSDKSGRGRRPQAKRSAPAPLVLRLTASRFPPYLTHLCNESFAVVVKRLVAKQQVSARCGN